MKKLCLICHENKIFSIIIGIQILIICYLCLGLLRTPYTLSVNPVSFANGQSDQNYEINENDTIVLKGKIDTSETIKFYSETQPIKSGAYNVFVSYTIDESSKELSSTNDTCYFTSMGNMAAITSDTISFDADVEMVKGKVWVSQFSKIDDFKMTILHSGEQGIIVESVLLEESLVWRYVVLIGYGLLFCMLDAIYIIFGVNKVHINKKLVNKSNGILLGIIFLSSLPLFADFLFEGHDLKFHLMRIASLGNELSYGQFPVRMYTDMLKGYSYPTSLFYCDIFLVIPAILYNCMVPLYLCYQIYMILLNIGTCLIAYYCFAKISNDSTLGIIGAGLYTLSAYRISNIYVRAALGEVTAMAFFPLVVVGIWEIYRKEKPKFKDGILLCLGMTGIAMSHVLSLEMVAIFILIYCVIFIKKTMQIDRMLVLIKIVVLTVGLTAWYLLPMLHAMITIDTEVVNNSIAKIQNYGTYLVQLFGIFMTGSGYNATGMQNEMPMNIGSSLTIGMVLALYCSNKRNEWQLEERLEYKTMKISFWMSVLALVMSTIYFPWDSIENIFGETIAMLASMVQFPWRYLSIATILLTTASIMSIKIVREKYQNLYQYVVGSIILGTLLTTGIFYLNYTNNVAAYTISTANEYLSMKVGAGEYLLQGSDFESGLEKSIQSDNESLVVEAFYSTDGIKYIECRNDSNETVQMLLPIFYYDNYHVYDIDTNEEQVTDIGENNRIEIYIGEGYEGTLVVKYESPLLYRIAEGISICVLLGIVAYMIKRRKFKKV